MNIKPNLSELSIRQQLIVGWVAMGLTVKQIAELLGIDHKTVSYYITGDKNIKLSIRTKLGFCDAARLTHYALLAGLCRIGETV